MRDELNSHQCAKYLKALADPERLRIVQCLRAGPLPVSDISDQLGSPMQNVSHHLKQLRVAGLVTSRRSGRQIIYTLAPRFTAKAPGTSLNVLEFGCCRVELTRK